MVLVDARKKERKEWEFYASPTGVHANFRTEKISEIFFGSDEFLRRWCLSIYKPAHNQLNHRVRTHQFKTFLHPLFFP